MPKIIHPKLTRVRSVWFHLFEIKRVLVYIIQQSLNLRICIYYTFSFKTYMPTKEYLKKVKKLCIRGKIVIESHSFLKY